MKSYQKNTLAILLVFIISLTFVSSQPPLQATDTQRGLQLQSPIPYPHKTNTNLTLFVHVFNSTDGLELHNNTVDYCTIHLYDERGTQIIEENMTERYDEWNYKILANNFTESGVYPLVFYCQDTNNVGGFLRTELTVSPTGLTNTLGFYIILIILSLGLIVIGYYAQDATIVILGSMGLVFVALYFLFYGINGIKDAVYTWAISIIMLSLSAYLMTKATQEFLN